MQILINNILAVLPMGDTDVIRQTDIYIKDDRIVGIGDGPMDFAPDKVIDGKNKLAIPGLINCHTHTYMAFMRNCADDLAFMDWLFGKIDPIESAMTEDDTYWGACLGMIEMIKSGTTCFNDMNVVTHTTPRATIESGMRGFMGRGLVGTDDDEAGRSRLAAQFKEIEDFKGESRVSFRLNPHAPYTCNDGFMKIVSDIAKREDLSIHTHLSESVSEISQIKEKYGCSPIELAARCGLFDVPCIAAHCVQIDDKDMDILKEHGVSVVTNPASNMKLGNGFAPVPEMLAKGINVCLGTDGAASNNCLNMFHEMSLLALIHKGTHKTPQCISSNEIFRIATINGARALGMEDQIGSLEVGKKADIAILDLNTPAFTPRNNLIAALSYSANGSEVDTVIVDGAVLMEGRKLLTMDEELVYKKCNETAKRLGLDGEIISSGAEPRR